MIRTGKYTWEATAEEKSDPKLWKEGAKAAQKEFEAEQKAEKKRDAERGKFVHTGTKIRRAGGLGTVGAMPLPYVGRVERRPEPQEPEDTSMGSLARRIARLNGWR